MGLIGGIVLIVLGGLCLPSLVAKKSPKAKELLDKIAPFQGTLGAGVFAYGLWGVISAVLTLSWLGSWPLWWATRLAGNLLSVAGGFILGFGMVQKFMLDRLPEEAKAKAIALREKLVASQTKVGLTSLAVGIWVILYELILQNIFNI